MTLHKDMSEGRSEDELGALIRWSLQERVAGNDPPPVVWERIRARAELPGVWRNLRSRTDYRAAMARLSKTSAFLLAQAVSWMKPRYQWGERRVEVGFDPFLACFLVDHCGSLWLRLAI